MHYGTPTGQHLANSIQSLGRVHMGGWLSLTRAPLIAPYPGPKPHSPAHRSLRSSPGRLSSASSLQVTTHPVLWSSATATVSQELTPKPPCFSRPLGHVSITTVSLLLRCSLCLEHFPLLGDAPLPTPDRDPTASLPPPLLSSSLCVDFWDHAPRATNSISQRSGFFWA